MNALGAWFNPRSSTAFVTCVLLCLAATPALAASGGMSAVDWPALGMGLFGGLALFLFGMEQMAAGLQAATGQGMKFVLARLTAT